MSENTGKTLLLLTAFVNGLSHRIRTPLSVVSNELSYFKTLIPEEECLRSLSRCKEIADILKEVSRPLQSSFKPEPCTLAFFLHELSEQKEFSNLKIAESSKLLLLDMPSLKRGFSLLLDAIAQFDKGSSEEFRDDSLSIDLEVNDAALRFIFRSKRAAGLKHSAEDRSCLSLTEFVCQLLDRDSYLVPLVEAVFLANGCSVAVRFRDSFSVSVEMPFCNE